MAEFTTVWQDNSPDSLLDTAIKICVQNPHILCKYTSKPTEYELMDVITLPEEICERILNACYELNRVIDDKLLTLFKDSSRTRLRRVKLHKSLVTDAGIEVISGHNVTELDISDCPKLTVRTRKLINRLGKSLSTLIVGNSVQVFNSPLKSEKLDLLLSDYPSHEVAILHEWGENPFADDPDFRTQGRRSVVLLTPHLRKLVVHNLKIALEKDYFPFLLEPLQFLTHLDLSQCHDLGDLNYLENHQNLISLILYNVPNLQDAVPSICHLKLLRHLDISQSEEQKGQYKNPNQVLKSILESLPNLVSLDISGTNLAGNRSHEKDEKDESDASTKVGKETEDPVLTDIPGLKSRVDRPLEFLGLFNTAHEACYRHHIPAKKIAGSANEDQILTAAQVYLDRGEQILKVLNELFKVFRFETCRNTRVALDVIIQAMRRHLPQRFIQISGSASLFYLVRGEVKTYFNIKVKKLIIRTVINAMETHIDDVTMLRNICLTLMHFNIPDDMLFEYKRLVELLLRAVAADEQDEFVERIGVYLLNSLVCQVDGAQKRLIGELGVIPVMLKIIKDRLDHNHCDEVMETAWSTMWNVTDETPENCERFLDCDGMKCFLSCLRTFPEKPELLRNMMGLLGNVAEVHRLRPRLMQNEYLATFSKLLDSTIDGIEVSYNAAGILAHIASDSPALWYACNVTMVRRDDVLARMKDAIKKWDLSTKRNINYRSLEPILRLVSACHSPQSQHWAVWALANLTRVYPNKYCPLLIEENGIDILKQLLQHNENMPEIEKLACLIITHCKMFEMDKKLGLQEHSNQGEDTDSE